MEHIRFENITKTFGSLKANDGVSFSVEKGEILSILGENGSGKTTLLNVLAGIYTPDEGKIFIDGNEVNITSPKIAYNHGLGMVHQHYKLVEAFTALENVVLGLTSKELRKIYGRIDASPISRFASTSLKSSSLRLKKMCDRYGFMFDPNKYVHDMTIGEKQTIEIIKSLFRGVDTLILDEPTAVLTPQEIKHLFDVIKAMRKDGKTIIIITHKLNEVMEISDRVAILRKGEYIDCVETSKTNEISLAEMMVGKSLELGIRRSNIPTTGDRLMVDGLDVYDQNGKKIIDDVSFTLHGSEILGVAGISNSGQKELFESLGGLIKRKDGSIVFNNPKKDKPVTFFHKNIRQIRDLSNEGKLYLNSTKERCDLSSKSNKEIVEMVNNEEILFYEDETIDLSNKEPLEIRDLGIKLSFVPEDRLGMGLVGQMDIAENMLLRSFRKGKGRLLRTEKSKNLAEKLIEELEVKTPSIHTSISKLSGGNIQKILVGREISSRPKILMVAYPVRGLDIKSSYLIYQLLDEQKQKGAGIIYAGEDLDVLLAISDRILVLNRGRVTGIVDARKTTKEEIGLLMIKGKEVMNEDIR